MVRFTATALAAVALLAVSPAAAHASAGVLAMATNDLCAVRSDYRPVCWGTWNPRLSHRLTVVTPAPKPVRGAGHVLAVDSNGNSRCYITTRRQVRCHGNNGEGELGDGTTTNNSGAPRTVRGLRRVTDLSVGYVSVCAIHNGGRASCWGAGRGGILGNGSNRRSTRPTPVPGIRDARAISTMSFDNACAVRRTGRVTCWGPSRHGIHTGPGNTPMTVPGIRDAVDVIVSGYTACALRRSHTVTCWGFWAERRHKPQTIPGFRGSRAISFASVSLCAIVDRGRVRCRDIDTARAFSPLPGITGAIAIAHGRDGIVCAVQRNRTVICEGDTTTTPINRARPAATTFTGVTDMAVAAGAGTPSCALTIAGTGVCFDSFNRRAIPDQMLTGASSVNAGGDLCALLPPGQIICRESQAWKPYPITGLADAVSLDQGPWNGCAVRADTTVSCWGVLPIGTDANVTYRPRVNAAVAVAGLTGVTEVAVSSYAACALTAGHVVCWGSGAAGQLGNGSAGANVSSRAPAPVPGITDAVAITAGDTHFCVLHATRTVSCWGLDTSVGAGVNLGRQRVSPTPVPGLTDIVQITAGNTHTCARTSDGHASCWGDGTYGQLGNSRTAAGSDPVSVDLDQITDISAGLGGSCVVRSDTRVWCWGETGRPGPAVPDPIRIPGLRVASPR